MMLNNDICRGCIKRELDVLNELVDKEVDSWERYCLFEEIRKHEAALKELEVFSFGTCPNPDNMPFELEECPLRLEHVVANQGE